MKTPRFASRLLPAILTAALLLTSLTGRADEPKPGADPTGPAAPGLMQPDRPPHLIDLDFPGGTIAQLVAAIAKSNPGAFNVVAEKADLEIQLPPFSLRNAEPLALASSISVLLRPRGLGFGTAGGTPRHGVFVVYKIDEGPRPFDPTRAAFQSFQLAPYLSGQTVDDIVGAIRAGWELDPAHDRSALRIRFHPPTSVLLVSGPPDAIVLAKDVLEQIRHTSTMNSLPGPTPTPATEPDKK